MNRTNEAMRIRSLTDHFVVLRAEQLETELRRINDKVTRMRSLMNATAAEKAAARDDKERYCKASRVAYLEAKQDGIDKALRSIEVKLDAHINIVDMLINDPWGLDDGGIEGDIDEDFLSAMALSSASHFFLSILALPAASSSPGRVSSTSTGGITTSSRGFLGVRMSAALFLLSRKKASSSCAASCFHRGCIGSSMSSPR